MQFGTSDLVLHGPQIKKVTSKITSHVRAEGRPPDSSLPTDNIPLARSTNNEPATCYQFGNNQMPQHNVNSIVPGCHDFVIKKLEVWKLPTTGGYADI